MNFDLLKNEQDFNGYYRNAVNGGAKEIPGE